MGLCERHFPGLGLRWAVRGRVRDASEASLMGGCPPSHRSLGLPGTHSSFLLVLGAHDAETAFNNMLSVKQKLHEMDPEPSTQ